MLPFSSRFTQCRLVIENVLIKGITNFGEFFENNSKEPHPKYFIEKLNFIKSKPGVKIVQIRSFSGPCFSIFGLNTVSLPIQSKCGKIRTRKTRYLDIFHAVEVKQKRALDLYWWNKTTVKSL